MKMPTKTVRIKDVAWKAGIHRSTVSRILNNRRDGVRISEQTRARVLKIAAELDYVPNHAARSLAQSATNTLGVYLYTDPATPLDFLHSYHTEILNGVESVCSKEGYDILIVNPDKTFQGHANDRRLLNQRKVDGAILVGTRQQRFDFFSDLSDAGQPTIGIDVFGEQVDTRCLRLDNRQSLEEAAHYLFGLGHRHIGFISVLVEEVEERERENGFRDALVQQGITDTDSYIISSRTTDLKVPFNECWCREHGRQALLELFRRRTDCTAVICVNDLVACGVLAAASELKLSVPDQLNVLGFDNSRISLNTVPLLSSVDHHFFEMGAQAAWELIDAIRGKHDLRGQEAHWICGSVVARETTCPFSDMSGPSI